MLSALHKHQSWHFWTVHPLSTTYSFAGIHVACRWVFGVVHCRATHTDRNHSCSCFKPMFILNQCNEGQLLNCCLNDQAKLISLRFKSNSMWYMIHQHSLYDRLLAPDLLIELVNRIVAVLNLWHAQIYYILQFLNTVYMCANCRVPAKCCRRFSPPLPMPCTVVPWTQGRTRWRHPPGCGPRPWAEEEEGAETVWESEEAEQRRTSG